MELTAYFSFVTCLLVSVALLHHTVIGLSDSEIIHRFEALEQAERDNQRVIQDLQTTIKGQKDTIDQLRQELAGYMQPTKPSNVDHVPNHSLGRIDQINRRLVLDADTIPKVAFTAYLSNGVSLASEQTVPFNKSVTNEGSGFNPANGIFTCPPGGDGVYLFTFVISAAGAADSIGAMLVADGVDRVGALVETYNTGEDAQGGNQAIVRLKAGDQVWVRQSYGKFIASSETYRGTSFTGVFLYR